MSTPHIAIIGVGMAGIACARTVGELGIELFMFLFCLFVLLWLFSV